ncbi:30S ribosomal protein S19 [Candidatus Woesearchaeota archaeon]|nr:30S ribosomal protein S19 [Candidatus Woesearchaeota archaeon]
MAKKELKWRGKSLEEVKQMDLKDFAILLPARQRRSLKRGLTETQKKLMKRIEKGDKNIKTHCRNMIIIPQMLGQALLVYNGKEFKAVRVELEMLGHYLGEFVMTRGSVSHSAPGIGATRSSAAVSVK